MEETLKNNETAQLGIGVVISRYICDECGWEGTHEEMKREWDFGYDQSCCPKCNNVMIDNLHGNIYVRKL